MVVLGSKEDLFPEIMTGMNVLRKEKTLYDVRIVVKGQEILAHKSVLAPVSDYFKSLFLGPFKTDSVIVEVDFSTIALDIESTEAVIEYLYTGTIDINDENLEAILKLAAFLLLKQLQDLCIKFMALSCDLNSYMRYFMLAVDYMVSDAEEVNVKIIKARFHDWFINRELSKSLSVCHLQKLAKNYNIFEHCSKIDTLLFLVDWVLTGKTDEHEALACEILDPKIEEKEDSDEDLQSDDEKQNNNESQDAGSVQHDDDEQQRDDAVQNDNEHQNNDDLQNDKETENQEEPHNADEEEEEEVNKEDTKQNCQPLSYDIPQKIHFIQSKLESDKFCTLFKGKCKEIIAEQFAQYTDVVKQTEESSTKEKAGTSSSDQQMPESDANERKRLSALISGHLSSDTPTVEKVTVSNLEAQNGNLSKQIEESDRNIKQDTCTSKQADATPLSSDTNVIEQLETRSSVSKIESLDRQPHNVHMEQNGITEETENQFSKAMYILQQNEICQNEENENLKEELDDSEVEQVLFAVAPKKLLNDSKRPSSISWYEKCFDICVYIPRHKTWYYFGAGANDGAFKKINESSSSWSYSWSHNFCTKDHLCLASPDESRLYMYPLEHSNCRWGPSWSTVSYEDLVDRLDDLQRSSDVRFCCADGETIYIVIKKKVYEPETKVKFKCYRLSAERSWEFMFETRYLQESEDYQLYVGAFDIYVSPENTIIVIAVVSRFYLHIFFIDLRKNQPEITYNFLEPGASEVEKLFFELRTDFWILFNDKHLVFVDENFLEPKYRYYTFMEADNSKGLSIGFTGHRWIEHDMPNNYKQTKQSKLMYSVSDNRSALAFLSDGKFLTSMEEIIIGKYGLLEFKQRTPPPFSTVTLMARGIVRKKHLAHLKPMKEFLHE